MMRSRTRWMAVIAWAAVASCAGSTSWAFLCPSPPVGPICRAQASLFCSNAITTPCRVDADCPGGLCNTAIIDGTVDGNGANVTSIVTSSGSSNLNLSTSGVGTATATFRVRQSGTSSPALGSVTAANANGSCDVPVSFTLRSAGKPTNEIICSMDPALTFKVTDGPVGSPAGVNACARHLYSCADGLPPNDAAPPKFVPLDFPAGTFVYSIASPIHSAPGQRDVTMEMVKSGSFDKLLRLAFARAPSGTSYTAFTDATTYLASGSTRIIGTGEWSAIRVAVAVSTVSFPYIIFPSLSVWGQVSLALLMLAAIVGFLWRFGATFR